jgi:hypothetical protein
VVQLQDCGNECWEVHVRTGTGRVLEEYASCSWAWGAVKGPKEPTSSDENRVGSHEPQGVEPGQ